MLTGISLSVFTLLLCCLTSSHGSSSCVPSSCGKINNISFPFRLRSDPKNCGSLKYELECQNNQLVLNLNSMNYQVESIDYERYTIRLLDPSVEKNNPCSFSLNYTENSDVYLKDAYSDYSPNAYMNIPLAFINCMNPVNSSTYVDISLCTRNGSSGIHSYVVAVEDLPLSELEVSCSIEKVIPIVRLKSTNYTSLSSIHEAVASGFELSWYYPLCSGCRGDCSINDNSLNCEASDICYEDTPYSETSLRCRFLTWWLPYIVFFGVFPIVGIMGLRLIFGLSGFIALLVYKRKRRQKWSEWEMVQDIVKGQNQFKPIQYSYSEIKKMTKNFKEKMVVGSRGNIFRGKLRSGPIVAVKTMDKATANSEEFLRFVAAVGSVHHQNVMQLIGFCSEGQNKRALVYDLMPNGSIQKYISDSGSLSCETLFGISLGVARGIHYLHRNLDVEAPHLGFTPHNVLLDENLVPKISDFGVGKLFPELGYAAPEFYYKSGGEIDRKADVYSFGMLLVEMISAMKNVNSTGRPEGQNESSSSSWVYDRLVEGKDALEIIRDGSAEERKMMKKMIAVASLCIKMKPVDRPSMDEVVKMLEEEDGDD